jgi:hypothetical protein
MNIQERAAAFWAVCKTPLAIVIIAAWSVWLASAHLAHGPESYYRQHDTAEAKGAFLVGQSAYAQRDLLGSWSPIAGAGVDSRANLMGVEPLFEAIYRIAPYWWTTGALVAAETFFAAFFTVVLLRRQLGVTLAPALLAGLAYSMAFDGGSGAFSGFFLNWGLLLPGFPLLLLALMVAGERRPPVAIASGAAIGIVLSLSAIPILVVLALPPIAWWMLVVERRPTMRHAAVLGVFALSFAIMAAPVFAAIALHAADSHRSLWPTVGVSAAEDASRWLDRRVETQTWLRITAPMLITALAGWLAGGWRTRPLNALLGISAGLIALQWFMVPVRVVLEQIAPAFATFQIDRMTQFLPFMSAAAGALGLQQLLRFFSMRRRSSVRATGLGLVGTAAAVLAGVLIARSIAVNQERENLRRYPSSYSGMLEQRALVRLAQQMRSEPPERIVTFADRNQEYSSQHPGFAWAQGLETADGYLNLYPRRYHTFWSWVIKPTFELRPDLQQYFDEWGNMFYVFDPYLPSKAIPNPIPASDIFNLRLLALVNVRYLVSPVGFSDPELIPWPGNEGVPTSEVQWTKTESGASVRALFVYENRLWLPRFFVTTGSRGFSHADQLLAALSAASPEELRNTAFLEQEQNAPPTLSVAGSPGSKSEVAVSHYSADLIELDVRTDVPGILVVSNNYSRFWRARVNDTSSPLMLVDFAFQGVRVPAGASRVRLQYEPPYGFPPWQCALAVAALAALLAGGWWAAERPLAIVASWAGWLGRSRWVMPSATLAIIAGSALLVFARPNTVNRPWADELSPHRAQLTIHPTGFSTPTDFPVLVERGPDDADFWRVAPDSAAGIRFVDAQGRLVPHETEHYDPSQRRMTAWVQVPGLGWGDRTIYMYFGGRTTSATERPAEVWGSRYIAVWHMDELADDGRIRDSTSHANHATIGAGMRGRWRTGGRMAGGVALNGTDRLTVPDADVWAFGEDDWALEFWINPAALERRNFGIVEHGPRGLFQLYLHSTNMLVLECTNAGQVGDHSFANVGLETGTWSHVSLSRRGRRLMLQVNGELKEAFDGKADLACGNAPHPLTIGWGSYGGLDGRLDEVRISRGPRPPGWSRAEYLSQTGRFVTYGAVEQRRPGS